MWWQLSRVALFVVVLDCVVVGLAAAGCLAFGALSAVNLGTALFALAVLVAFLAVGLGDGPSRMGMPVLSRTFERTFYENQVRAEMEQGMSPIERTREAFLVKPPSWPLAFGVAAIPLVALSIVLVTSAG